MGRSILAALLLVAPCFGFQDKQTAPPAQDQLKTERPQPPKPDKYAPPPEEDESVATPTYAFNPVQSNKEVDVGDQYLKKGNYRAAVGRYREALKWNDENARAWLRLGEASEKARDPKSAKDAYTKYLTLAADAKNAPEIRKKLAKLK